MLNLKNDMRSFVDVLCDLPDDIRLSIFREFLNFRDYRSLLKVIKRLQSFQISNIEQLNQHLLSDCLHFNTQTQAYLYKMHILDFWSYQKLMNSHLDIPHIQSLINLDQTASEQNDDQTASEQNDDQTASEQNDDQTASEQLKECIIRLNILPLNQAQNDFFFFMNPSIPENIDELIAYYTNRKSYFLFNSFERVLHLGDYKKNSNIFESINNETLSEQLEELMIQQNILPLNQAQNDFFFFLNHSIPEIIEELSAYDTNRQFSFLSNNFARVLYRRDYEKISNIFESINNESLKIQMFTKLLRSHSPNKNLWVCKIFLKNKNFEEATPYIQSAFENPIPNLAFINYIRQQYPAYPIPTTLLNIFQFESTSEYHISEKNITYESELNRTGQYFFNIYHLNSLNTSWILYSQLYQFLYFITTGNEDASEYEEPDDAILYEYQYLEFLRRDKKKWDATHFSKLESKVEFYDTLVNHLDLLNNKERIEFLEKLIDGFIQMLQDHLINIPRKLKLIIIIFSLSKKYDFHVDDSEIIQFLNRAIRYQKNIYIASVLVIAQFLLESHYFSNQESHQGLILSIYNQWLDRDLFNFNQLLFVDNDLWHDANPEIRIYIFFEIVRQMFAYCPSIKKNIFHKILLFTSNLNQSARKGEEYDIDQFNECILKTGISIPQEVDSKKEDITDVIKLLIRDAREKLSTIHPYQLPYLHCPQEIIEQLRQLEISYSSTNLRAAAITQQIISIVQNPTPFQIEKLRYIIELINSNDEIPINSLVLLPEILEFGLPQRISSELDMILNEILNINQPPIDNIIISLFSKFIQNPYQFPIPELLNIQKFLLSEEKKFISMNEWMMRFYKFIRHSSIEEKIKLLEILKLTIQQNPPRIKPSHPFEIWEHILLLLQETQVEYLQKMYIVYEYIVDFKKLRLFSKIHFDLIVSFLCPDQLIVPKTSVFLDHVLNLFLTLKIAILPVLHLSEIFILASSFGMYKDKKEDIFVTIYDILQKARELPSRQIQGMFLKYVINNTDVFSKLASCQDIENFKQHLKDVDFHFPLTMHVCLNQFLYSLFSIPGTKPLYEYRSISSADDAFYPYLMTHNFIKFYLQKMHLTVLVRILMNIVNKNCPPLFQFLILTHLSCIIPKYDLSNKSSINYSFPINQLFLMSFKGQGLISLENIIQNIDKTLFTALISNHLSEDIFNIMLPYFPRTTQALSRLKKIYLMLEQLVNSQRLDLNQIKQANEFFENYKKIETDLSTPDLSKYLQAFSDYKSLYFRTYILQSFSGYIQNLNHEPHGYLNLNQANINSEQTFSSLFKQHHPKSGPEIYLINDELVFELMREFMKNVLSLYLDFAKNIFIQEIMNAYISVCLNSKVSLRYRQFTVFLLTLNLPYKVSKEKELIFSPQFQNILTIIPGFQAKTTLVNHVQYFLTYLRQNDINISISEITLIFDYAFKLETSYIARKEAQELKKMAHDELKNRVSTHHR